MSHLEEIYLQISGLQHFAFCRRQWALIHIENQWAENLRTVEGEIMHKKAHDSSKTEQRDDLLIVRGLRVASESLHLSGTCDVVEFRRCESGVELHGRKGKWQPMPVEYKRGSPKAHDADRLQLCAQAMCLEDMLCCNISFGALFYGETHRREEVEFSDELRARVRSSVEEMLQMYLRGYTPRVRRSKSCNACSLKEICLPQLDKKQSASSYIMSHLED